MLLESLHVVQTQARNQFCRGAPSHCALVLEFSASLLAFTEAVQAGALYGAVECGHGGRLERLHQSERIQDKCAKMDASVAARIGDNNSFQNVGCEPTEAPTGEDSFLAQCSCPPDEDRYFD